MKAMAKPKLYVQVPCVGLQLSWQGLGAPGKCGIGPPLFVYRDGIRICGSCLQEGLLLCSELQLGYDAASKATSAVKYLRLFIPRLSVQFTSGLHWWKT